MSNAIVEEMLSTKTGIAVCWLGNLSWLIAEEGRMVAFDLDLDSDMRLAASPVSPEDVGEALDAMFITHSHGDHFCETTCRRLVAASACLFVIPSNCVETAEKIGIPDERIRVARPREPFDLEGVHVEPIRALHGRRHFTVSRNASLDDCGYVLTVGGKTFLQPGDSVLLDDHLALEHVDVLFVSPNEHNTHIAGSAMLLNTLEPSWIFPQHFGTYGETLDNMFWTKGYPDELRDILPRAMQQRYHKLEQGDVFVIE